MPSPEAKEVSREDHPGRSYLMSPAGLPAESRSPSWLSWMATSVRILPP